MFARRFFYTCAGLLCLALAYHLGAAAAQAQDEQRAAVSNLIETRHLAIVDEQGRSRADIASKDGATYLLLRDSTGTMRASVMVMDKGTSVVTLSDADGVIRTSLTADAVGPSLALLDAQGKGRLHMSVSGESGPVIALTDEAQSTRVMVGMSVLALMDKQKQVVWRTPKQ